MRSGDGKLVVALGLVVAAGCGGGAETAPGPSRPGAAASAPAEGATAARISLPARRITEVPPGTFGPYVGVRDEGAVVAWAPETSEGKREWYAVGLDASFAPLREPVHVVEAPAEIDLVAVRPLAQKALSGFLLLQSSRDFSGARVDALALDLDGHRKGGPTPLARSLPSVVWLDAVATSGGGLALWAVPREGRADLFAAPLGPAGEPKGEASKVLTDVTAWQVAALDDAVAVAGVLTTGQRGGSGPVEIVLVDAAGRPGPRKSVSQSPTADADLDMVRMGTSLVLAWSDRRELEPRIYGAVTDLAGQVTREPAALVGPFGPQALIRLVAPAAAGGAAYLAWENTLERTAAARAIRVVALGPGGAPAERSATLDLAAVDGTVPEMAATTSGLAAITVAPACRRGGACLEGSGAPTFVALDASLRVTASEPMRLDAEGGDVADLVWGLTCRAEGCMSLAAAPETPAPVYAVGLRRLSDSWVPAARSNEGTSTSGSGPQVTAIEAVGLGEPAADLATALAAPGAGPPSSGVQPAAIAGGAADPLLAWVTYFDPSTPFTRSKTPAPDGKYEPIRAVLRVRALDGAPGAGETVVSYRADSRGGVALSRSDQGETLLAWAGIDAKVPQVFLTLLGPGGKKVGQKMLTRAKGGVSDIAAVFVGDGWVVAWVDETGGAFRARVAKVDRSLKIVAPERPIGAGQFPQTDVALLARVTDAGPQVVVAVSEGSGSESGAGDIVVARLSGRDLAPLGQEGPVARTPPHSRSPALAGLGSDVVVTWIEDSPPSASGPSALRVGVLVAGEKLEASGVVSVTSAGSVEAASVTCGQSGCRIVASVSEGEGGQIEAFDWKPGTAPRAATLVRLESPPRDAVAPLLIPGGLLYADAVRGAGPDRGRVRRLSVAFP